MAVRPHTHARERGGLIAIAGHHDAHGRVVLPAAESGGAKASHAAGRRTRRCGYNR